MRVCTGEDEGGEEGGGLIAGKGGGHGQGFGASFEWTKRRKCPLKIKSKPGLIKKIIEKLNSKT